MGNTMHVSTGIANLKGNEILAMLQKTEAGTFVAIKPLCNHLRLSWGGQSEKLATNPRFSCTDIRMTGVDGKTYMMTCLPSEQVVDWVNSINSAKVAEEKRGTLLQLQKFFQHALNEIVHGNYVTKADMESMRTEFMGIINHLREDLAAKEETIQYFFRSSKHQASAAAYEMNAAKELKKAIQANS